MNLSPYPVALKIAYKQISFKMVRPNPPLTTEKIGLLMFFSNR